MGEPIAAHIILKVDSIHVNDVKLNMMYNGVVKKTGIYII